MRRHDLCVQKNGGEECAIFLKGLIDSQKEMTRCSEKFMETLVECAIYDKYQK